MSIGFNCQRQWNRRRAQNLRLRALQEIRKLNLNSELTRFWTHCNGYDMPQAARMARLKEFAEIVIWKPNTGTRKFQRQAFVSGFCRRGIKCFACGLFARIRHHIIQLQNGGNNSKKNIVPLCLACHAEIHPWLNRVDKPLDSTNKVLPVNNNLSCPQALTLQSQNGSQLNYFSDSGLPGVEAVIAGHSCEEIFVVKKKNLRGGEQLK